MLIDGIEIPDGQEYPITKQDHIEIPPPDLATVMNKKMKAMKAEINCCQAGTVQAFYPATQTVDVTLNVHRIVENEVKQYPVLVQVPVFIVSGGTGRLTMPIAAGDQCIVLFCDRSIEAWATAGTVAAPSSERTHDLSDGVALIGFFPANKSIAGYESNGAHSWHGAEKEAKLSLEAAVKAQLEHKTARVTLIDGQEASLIQGANGIKVMGKIDMHVGAVTMKQALDDLCENLKTLCDNLTAFMDTRNDTPNAATLALFAATKIAVTATKVKIDGILQ